MKRLLNTLKNISARTLAFIILKVSGTGGGTMLLGGDRILAVSMAAYIGIMEVAEEMSRNYLNDGKIDNKEIEASFKDLADKQKEK